MKELNESQLGVRTVTGPALQAFAPVVWKGQRLAPLGATPCPGQGSREGGERPGESRAASYLSAQGLS